jgi:hypothetical protein
MIAESPCLTVSESQSLRVSKSQSLPLCIPMRDRAEFDRLPCAVRDDVQHLLLIIEKVHKAESVKGACRAFATNKRGFKPASLRRKYYAYVESGGDWRKLVDNARAGGPHASVLPEEFLEYWRKLCGNNKRKSAPAWRTMLEEWRTGHNKKGDSVLTPGYGKWQDWFKKEFPDEPLPITAPIPKGWDYSNLMRPHNRLTKAQQAAARIGGSHASAFLPCHQRTREGLRFLEEVMFDDVKTDFRVVDPASGQVCDLWLLIAHDRATDMRLGYGMLPARARDDGSQEHLKLFHMKQLAGWVLQRWGLPPYPIKWKVERGTATFAAAVADAIKSLTEGKVTVSFSKMIGGKAPSGYREKGIGNSRAKATLESGNNLFHNEAGDLPGQTGRRYDVRPTDLPARENETREVLELNNLLSPELRIRLQYPVLTLEQARVELNRIFGNINNRTDHKLEGFEWVWEWRIDAQHPWQPIHTMPPEISSVPGSYETQKRKHSPHERMIQLTRGLEWHRVSDSILVHFFRDSQKIVTVNDRGEIDFDVDGKSYTFLNPTRSVLDCGSPLPLSPILPGQKYLAYFHAAELDFIHLTKLPPHEGYVATWPRRERVRNGDERALQEAMRYTEAARKAEFETLNARHADEARANEERRQQNAALLAEHQANQQAIEVNMHQVAPSHSLTVSQSHSLSSPIAAALDAARTSKAQHKQTKKDFAALADAALSKANQNQP